ncbi:hypothetical protein PAN31117_00685 [Pandoraea anapnoica]|uniref:Inclusion body protein n=2 Tax=Pandoraea anapnoica TaxID=2508301 RepID=A0A5E4ZL71_9BURK|nr:hypothetical protein PAN31117_00685 [Pandoraea anapnoica]
MPESQTSADVLLIIDAAALLAGASASDCCYALCTGLDSLLTSNGGQLHLNAIPGERVSIRWSPTSVRGEQAILLDLHLPNDDVLSNLVLTTNPDVTLFVPQMDDPTKLETRTTLDACWEVDVVAEGSVDMQIEAIVTDRNAEVIGTFRWPLSIVAG